MHSCQKHFDSNTAIHHILEVRNHGYHEHPNWMSDKDALLEYLRAIRNLAEEISECDGCVAELLNAEKSPI